MGARCEQSCAWDEFAAYTQASKPESYLLRSHETGGKFLRRQKLAEMENSQDERLL